MHGRYVTDILKMCMKKFNAEKNNFYKFTNLQRSGVRYLPPPCSVLEQRHIYSQKNTVNTQEVVTPSRHDCKIVDWDIKHQHKQTNKFTGFDLHIEGGIL